MRSAIRKLVDNAGGEYVLFWCPGCDSPHAPVVKASALSPSAWGWNGSLERPTFTPSILSAWDEWQGEGVPPKKHVCHSFVTDGRIQFLGDCTHALAGQTVPLPEFDQ